MGGLCGKKEKKIELQKMDTATTIEHGRDSPTRYKESDRLWMKQVHNVDTKMSKA